MSGENMIYTTGTIAVSGNTLTGTGTNFTAAGSLIRNGCTVIVFSTPVQVFQITAIGSATSLTVTPAANPAIAAGTRYAILLSDSLSVDGLAQDIAETFGMYQRYIGGFADVMNSEGDVTITINGQPVTVPGQKSLAKKGANSDITSLSALTTALSVAQGGTGAKDAAGARSNLGLKSASLLDAQTSTVDASSGVALITGAWGLGAGGINSISWSDLARQGRSSFASSSVDSPLASTLFFGINASHHSDNGYAAQFAARGTFGFYWRTREATNFSIWRKVYDDGNTTKASDGTLKAASPVARIVQSQEACQRTDVADDGFIWCGCGTANAEAEGITISRLDKGVYTLTGAAGLASSGWQLLPPRDPQGSGDMGIVEAEQTESGGLTIRLYRRRYVLTDDGEIEVQKGAAIDVPPTSWIDIRLDMPENSIWNLKKSARGDSLKQDDVQP